MMFKLICAMILTFTVLTSLLPKRWSLVGGYWNHRGIKTGK